MLATAAPPTVAGTLNREPRKAAVIAASAPPSTWVRERSTLFFAGSSTEGSAGAGERFWRCSVLMSSVRFGRGGGPRGAPRPVPVNAADRRIVVAFRRKLPTPQRPGERVRA